MWHHDVTNARTCQFFRRLFDRLPVRISTSDLHHRILRKKTLIISELMILECSFPLAGLSFSFIINPDFCNPNFPSADNSFFFMYFVSSLISAIKCESLPPPQNGNVTYSTPPSNNKIAWNEKATFSCNLGYALEGDKTRTCFYSKNEGVFGQWTHGMSQSCVGEFFIWASKDRQKLSCLLCTVRSVFYNHQCFVIFVVASSSVSGVHPLCHCLFKCTN